MELDDSPHGVTSGMELFDAETITNETTGMGQDDLQSMACMVDAMEPDDLKEFLEVSIGDFPPETLGVISLALFDKTNIIEHMEKALSWAAQVDSAIMSHEDLQYKLGILGSRLGRSDEALLRATRLGLAKILHVLLDTRRISGIEGLHLLHEACKVGHSSVARLLLVRGLNPDQWNADGETALSISAEHGHDAIIGLLLDSKADVNLPDQNGESPLLIAIYRGFENTTKLLLEKGANCTNEGGKGYTPMQWALNEGKDHLVKLLLKHGAVKDVADDTEVPLNEICGGDKYQQIEQAQGIMASTLSDLSWLDHMRFVVGTERKMELIEPGPENTMVQPYIAISYCWGRTPCTKARLQIRCPSRTKPGSSDIRDARASTNVLQRCLKYAATKGVKRIWIDQECIDQDNGKEKNCAMQNMHLVYSQADVTLVLLGKHVRTLAEIASLHELSTNPSSCSKLKERIFEDKWFTRAWTCQEFGVTPKENLRYLVEWDDNLDVAGQFWNFASANFNRRSTNIKQTVSRSWEFRHREIGQMLFHGGKPNAYISGLSSEVGMIATNAKDNIAFLLADDGIAEMYWWKHGLTLFTRGNNDIPNEHPASCGYNKEPRTGLELPKLQMTLLTALFVQRKKPCKVFSDKFAIIGNMTNYRYRMDPARAIERGLSFSACVLAMALYNGDLSPLFTNDTAYLNLDTETDVPRGQLLSHTHLYRLADGRSAYHQSRAQITAGSRCLALGGRLLLESILWQIVPFTDFEGVEKTIQPTRKGATKDPIRFYFLQALVLKIVELNRVDLLELVVASVMQRQLTSPLELVQMLNDLLAWSHNEQIWPERISEESLLQHSVPEQDIVVESWDGKRRKIARYTRAREPRGMDMAICELESEDSEPKDLLSYIYRAIHNGQPLALGQAKVGDQTLVSIFTFDPSEHQWILTPVHELDYEYGNNPWLHAHSKDTFWSVTQHEKRVPDATVQMACQILELGADGEKRFSGEPLEVVTSGTRSHITGIWSPRLSQRGLLTISEDGLWNMVPLGDGTLSGDRSSQSELS